MRVAVIGTGLIGGSMALALKKTGFASWVIGVDSKEENLQKALKVGIIDEAASLDDIYEKADLILISIPVNVIEKLLPTLLDSIKEQTIVVDLGSTKQKICKSVEGHPKRGNFVAAHPIAGTENSGPEAAIADLYENKQIIICEAEKSSPFALKLVKDMLLQLNMNILEMEPETHDLHIAYVSHLSHISSFSLAQTVLNKEKAEPSIFKMAGGGFSSTTRLAKSSPAMWSPIIEQNKENILTALKEHIENLVEFQRAISEDDPSRLIELMENGNDLKSKLKH
jgi:prephenate dehydrogenase